MSLPMTISIERCVTSVLASHQWQGERQDVCVPRPGPQTSGGQRVRGQRLRKTANLPVGRQLLGNRQPADLKPTRAGPCACLLQAVTFHAYVELRAGQAEFLRGL